MKRVLTIWAALGAVYVALEILFRGRSHPAMLIVGGLCGVLVGAINRVCKRVRSEPLAGAGRLGL